MRILPSSGLVLDLRHADASPIDAGVQQLFDSLLTVIIKRKDTIEAENELKKRDSVYLTPTTVPMWAAQADQEEAREKAEAEAAVSARSWKCCSV